MKKTRFAFILAMILLLPACLWACQQNPDAPEDVDVLEVASPPTPTVLSTPTPVESTSAPIREELPYRPKSWLERAEEHRENGDFHKAVEAYTEAMWEHESVQPYISLADYYMEYGLRSDALYLLKTAIQDQYRYSLSDADKEQALSAWWDIMVHTDTGQGQKLNTKELRQIGELTYFMQETECFAFSSELSKGRLLYHMYIYYSKYDEYDTETGISFFNPLPYPVDTIASGMLPQRYPEYLEGMGMDYAVVSADTVSRFVKDLLHAEVPWLHEDFLTEFNILGDSYVFCENGKYYFAIGDYIGCEYYVEGYQYLGDNQFYVILGEDWSRAPGNIEEANYYISDRLHLILQRSDSAWGFTVVSKVRDEYEQDSILREGWRLPDRIIQVESAESMLEKYVP